jgi:hypothetical protein
LFTEVSDQDCHFGVGALGENPKARSRLWHYIRDNFTTLRERFDANLLVLSRILSAGLKGFADRETEKDITSFFKAKDNSGYDRSIKIASDTILGRVSYGERDVKVLLEWLTANGYA